MMDVRLVIVLYNVLLALITLEILILSVNVKKDYMPYLRTPNSLAVIKPVIWVVSSVKIIQELVKNVTIQ